MYVCMIVNNSEVARTGDEQVAGALAGHNND